MSVSYMHVCVWMQLGDVKGKIYTHCGTNPGMQKLSLRSGGQTVSPHTHSQTHAHTHTRERDPREQLSLLGRP